MKKTIKSIRTKFQALALRTQMKLTEKKGEGYIDSAVKIIIGVVIGGLILAGLYTLFNTTVIPNMQSEIGDMFSFSG